MSLHSALSLCKIHDGSKKYFLHDVLGIFSDEIGVFFSMILREIFKRVIFRPVV